MTLAPVCHQRLEWHQIALPFSRWRVHSTRAIEALARSIEECGQQVPVLVIDEAGQRTLVDGYRRCEALRRTGHDLIWAECWRCDLASGLLMSLARGQSRPWHPIEEAGLIREIIDRQGLSQREIARRSGRDVSWINRRLALIESLPESVLQAVCAGRLPTWAACRVLAPLARANSAHAERLLASLEAQGFSARELLAWFDQYRRSHRARREALVAVPMLFIKAWRDQQQRQRAQRLATDPPSAWCADLRAIRRLCDQLRQNRASVFEPHLPADRRHRLLDELTHTEQAVAALVRDCRSDGS